MSAQNVCVKLLLTGLKKQTLNGLFKHPPNNESSFEDLVSEAQSATVERLSGGMDDLGASARTPGRKARRPKTGEAKPEWVSLIPKEPTPPPPPKPVDPFAHLQSDAKYSNFGYIRHGI